MTLSTNTAKNRSDIRQKSIIDRLIEIAPCRSSSDSALASGRRAYAQWFENFTYTARRHGYAIQHARPPDFDTHHGIEKAYRVKAIRTCEQCEARVGQRDSDVANTARSEVEKQVLPRSPNATIDKRLPVRSAKEPDVANPQLGFRCR